MWNLYNFWPWISQPWVTNVNEYNPTTKKSVNIFTKPQEKVVEKPSLLNKVTNTIIPTANANESWYNDIIQTFLDDSKAKPELWSKRQAVIEMLQNWEEKNFIEDVIINKMWYKGIQPAEQPKQEPQVTEQSFWEMGLNIAWNIYKWVENLGADAINIWSSAIWSDFRVKPLRDQLFNNTEEYKGWLSQDIANKIYKRWEKMANISENSINQTQWETSFQFWSNIWAWVTDTIGEVFFSWLSTLTPDSQKEKLNNYIWEIAKTEGWEMAINKAKELKTKYQEFKFNNPRAWRNTDAVLDTLNFITNSWVIKFWDKAINTWINKVWQWINTLKTEVKEWLDRWFSIPWKGKTVVDNTIQNTTKAKTKWWVEFDIEDRPWFTTKIFDKILSKDNEILAQQSVMPKATKEKTLKWRSQSSKTALEWIEQLYEDKAKGIIQEDIKSMPWWVNWMDEWLSYYWKKIWELTDNKAIIDTTDLVNSLEKSLNEPFSWINSSMKSVATNIIDEFKKINYQASIGDLQNALSNIKSEIFSNAENITKLYKTNTWKALNNFLNEIDIRFNKTIENTTWNLPELLEAKKAYSKYKKIQKDFTDSLMVDIRNQWKWLTWTAWKIAWLYEVLNNPSMSWVFKAVVLKNVAEKMQYYKTRSWNYETLIRKLDKEALERFKTNNLENDINSNISRSTDTTEPIKALQPWKKEPIITPQTLDNAIIQQSKSDLQKAKIGTTTPQPKLLKKSPLSDREKAIIRKEQQTAPLISWDKTPQVLETPNKDMVVPKPKVWVKIWDKRPLLKDKIWEDTNIKEEPRFRNKSWKEISKEVSDKEIEDYFYNNLPNVSKEDLKPYLENEEMRKIAKSFILQERQRWWKPYEWQFDKDFDRLPKVDWKPTLELPATRTKKKQIVEAKDDYVLAINRETYINLPPMTREKAVKITEANKTLVKWELINKHFDIMPRQYVEHMGYKQVEDTKWLLNNKPLLKKEPTTVEKVASDTTQPKENLNIADFKKRQQWLTNDWIADLRVSIPSRNIRYWDLDINWVAIKEWDIVRVKLWKDTYSKPEEFINNKSMAKYEVVWNKNKPLLKKENLEKAKEMFKKDDDLIKEAKKYESADDFIKSQELVYHWTNAKFKEFDLSKTWKNFNISKWISFTNNKDFVAEKYGENIIKAKINLNNPLIVKADLKTTKWQVQTAVSMADEQLINFNNLNKKYDWIITEDYRWDKVYIVFDPKNIKTEAQLKEIYNKANPTKKLLSKENLEKAKEMFKKENELVFKTGLYDIKIKNDNWQINIYKNDKLIKNDGLTNADKIKTFSSISDIKEQDIIKKIGYIDELKVNTSNKNKSNITQDKVIKTENPEKIRDAEDLEGVNITQKQYWYWYIYKVEHKNGDIAFYADNKLKNLDKGELWEYIKAFNSIQSKENIFLWKYKWYWQIIAEKNWKKLVTSVDWETYIEKWGERIKDKMFEIEIDKDWYYKIKDFYKNNWKTQYNYFDEDLNFLTKTTKEKLPKEFIKPKTEQSKETPTKNLLSKEKVVKEEVVKKDIEWYTQSLINKRGEYLEISKRYQNILREIENEKNLIKLKELKKQEKIIWKELNDFANNSNYKSYEAKANIKNNLNSLTKSNIDEIASKITTDTTNLAKVKEVIQKYIKEYGDNIKNYLWLLADDIADIVGWRAKLLWWENAKLFDKSRWEQAKEMTNKMEWWKAMSVSDELINEAKKYKSFDEFKKSQGQEFYHWTKQKFDRFDLSKIPENEQWLYWRWIYITPDKVVTQTYWWNLINSYLDKGANLIKWDEKIPIKNIKNLKENIRQDFNVDTSTMEYIFSIPPKTINLYKRLQDILEISPKKASDLFSKSWIDWITVYKNWSLREISLFSENKIKTEAQLKQIYEQATKTKLLKKAN